jgi:predicted phage baseplate assembly protein
VNDLLWHEVPSLYGHGPSDRVFITRHDDRDITSVVFGDGVEGARLPSGSDNVRAQYRKGIGVAGNLDAGRIGTLVTRPLGVTGVTNPEPAHGGQDPEEQRATRSNAPLSVLTLDRAVSLQDYEDFSRIFAGIAKAHAAWIPAGPGRGVLVSVAGENGDAVDPSDKTYSDLLSALRKYGDAMLSLRLESYRSAMFRLRASIKVDPDADPEIVVAGAREALRAAFSFDARGFGQMVSVDEVDLVLHRVPGLVAANVIELYRPDQGATPRLEARVFARLPETSLTALPLAAELLILDPHTLAVEVMP